MKRTPMPARTTPLRAKAPIKRKAVKTTAVRKSARGQPCLIRLPGCDGGGDTTVLAHYRLSGQCGTGMKPPDILGAYSCARCHDRADFRVALVGWDRTEIRLAHAEGVLRTIALIGQEE